MLARPVVRDLVGSVDALLEVVRREDGVLAHLAQTRAVTDTAGSGRSFVDNLKVSTVEREQQEVTVACR